MDMKDVVIKSSCNLYGKRSQLYEAFEDAKKILIREGCKDVVASTALFLIINTIAEGLENE